ARAADLEVVHGEIETRAQLLHHLDRLEALLRSGGERVLAGSEQVGVGLVVRAPDTAPQLMKLSESEFIRALDNDRVGRRNIYSGLDNGRAEEEVVPLLQKLAHHALEVPLAHLPVRHRDPRFGKELLQLLARDLDGGDVVVQEEDLTPALELSERRLADNAGRIRRDEGADREAPLGGGGDQ